MPNVNPQNGVAYKKNVYPRLSFVQYLETGASRNTKFGSNVSNKMLLNAAKCQGYSFYRLGIKSW